MLSEKHAALAVKILALCLVAALSFFVAANKIPEWSFVENSMESLDESSNTVMRLSAATLSASLAISALPDDFATPLADSLADMNVYFIAILVVLFLEKILIRYGVKAAFGSLIPVACGMWGIYMATKKGIIKGLALRFCVLGLAVAFVVPCSTYITEIVASDLTVYVNETIEEAEGGAGKLNEAMQSGDEEQSIFDKLSGLFQSAINSVSDLMLHFQNTIRKCMNSIAILILTNCLMPLFTFFFLKWILKELFLIIIPMPPMGRHDHTGPKHDSEAEREPVSIGD